MFTIRTTILQCALAPGLSRNNTKGGVTVAWLNKRKCCEWTGDQSSIALCFRSSDRQNSEANASQNLYSLTLFRIPGITNRWAIMILHVDNSCISQSLLKQSEKYSSEICSREVKSTSITRESKISFAVPCWFRVSECFLQMLRLLLADLFNTKELITQVRIC